MILTDGTTRSTKVSLPDAVGMLALKAMVRTVRAEARDAEDLWRCLEVDAADGVEPSIFDSSEPAPTGASDAVARAGARGRRTWCADR